MNSTESIKSAESMKSAESAKSAVNGSANAGFGGGTRRMAGAAAIALALAGGACSDLVVPNFNDPSVEDLTTNPTVNSVVAAAQNLMVTARGNTSSRVLYVGVWGREAYDLRPEEPRTTTNRLIGPLDPVNGGAFWGYSSLKNIQVLLDAVDAVEAIPESDKNAIRGFAKTVAAQSLWNIVIMHTTFGAALEPPGDPGDELSPIVSEAEVHARIHQLLDEAQQHLSSAGNSFPFGLTSGYAGFSSPAEFTRLNRALKARYHKYRGEWSQAMGALSASFMNPAGDLGFGLHHNYSTNPGDASSPFFSVASHYAHPRFLADAQAKPDGTPDDRATSKTAVQPKVFSLLGIDVTEKFTIYDRQDSPLPWVRNEELVLMHAEIALATGDRQGAVDDLNIVRAAHGLAPFADPGNDAAVLDEILYNRFMSLVLEGGFAYFDARQYGRTDQLPRARADHVVFPQLPFPQNECLARPELGTGRDQPCGTIYGN